MESSRPKIGLFYLSQAHHLVSPTILGYSHDVDIDRSPIISQYLNAHNFDIVHSSLFTGHLTNCIYTLLSGIPLLQCSFFHIGFGTWGLTL